MRTPNERFVAVNGLELCLFDWPAPAGAPVALFAHATGFHARTWDQVIAALPAVRCVAIDLRGHGRSAKPPPPYAWRDISSDVAGVASVLDLSAAIAVGHSFGGYAITEAAALEPPRFGGLLLVDPVILERSRYALSFNANSSFVARRRNRWSSPDEMFASFAKRPPFSTWQPAVLRDYADHGLLPASDGDGYILACPPEIEAAVYAGSTGGGQIYDAMPNLNIPVTVMRAKGREPNATAVDMSGSPTTPNLATFFHDAEDLYVPQYSHFIPMEDPAFIAEHVRLLIARAGNQTAAPDV